MQPEYGMLRRSELRKAFREIWIDGQEVEMDLGELINMFGRNQLGCQDQGCVSGQVEEFARGGNRQESSKRPSRARSRNRYRRNQTESKSDLSTRRTQDWAPLRIINGRE